LIIFDFGSCRALFYLEDARRADVCGLQQAVGDWLEDMGAIKNDFYIDNWDGTRRLIDRSRPRVEIEIRRIGGQPVQMQLPAEED